MAGMAAARGNVRMVAAWGSAKDVGDDDGADGYCGDDGGGSKARKKWSDAMMRHVLSISGKHVSQPNSAQTGLALRNTVFHEMRYVVECFYHLL